VLLASGCGGASSPSVANVRTTTTSTAGITASTNGAAGSNASPTGARLSQDALKFARCMRSHGVPEFPDPSSSGGFVFQAGSGFDPSSPSVVAAQAKCQKYMPGPGLAPGTMTHPSRAWLAHMVKVSQCMRRHGVPGFPDPATTVPPLPSGGGVISDIEGAVFVFPQALDIQSRQFTRAATMCGFPLHNH
jgi:hypothetical protein